MHNSWKIKRWLLKALTYIVAYHSEIQEKAIKEYPSRPDIRYLGTLFNYFHIVYPPLTLIEKRKCACLGLLLGALFF